MIIKSLTTPPEFEPWALYLAYESSPEALIWQGRNDVECSPTKLKIHRLNFGWDVRPVRWPYRVLLDYDL